ncbi:MAG: hypothetical protein WC408_05535 [Candidatus Micrarchaeia archaeon]|jgi:hypothetical protein
MLDFSKLSESQVRACASSAVFQRGKEYFKDGCVRDALLVSPSRIEGHVQGNRLYKTKVMVEEGELACECSCPFDWELFCKHGVALLLYWLYKKKDVPKLENLKGELLKKSKNELADLVLTAARKDARVYGKLNKTANKPVSFEAFRRQVSQLFSRRDFWDWDEVDDLAEELGELVDEGKQYLEKNDAASALSCFEAVAYGIIDKVNDTHTEGQLEEVFSNAAGQMVVAFNKTPHAPDQSRTKLEKWIKTAVDCEYGFEGELLDAILENLDSERLGLAEEAAKKILEEKTPEKERPFRCRQLVGFVLDLQIRQGKEKEAIQTGQAHFEYAYERLVDYYLRKKKYDQAIQTAENGLCFAKGFEVSDLKAKIAEAQKATGKPMAAFNSLLEAFIRDWDLAKYEQMKSLGLAGWAEKRKIVLGRIQNAGERTVLAQALAMDGDIAGLEKLLSKLTKDDDEELRIIEKALRRKAPANSVKALRLLALHSLRWTDRNGYRMAAGYLKQAKTLLIKNGLGKELSDLKQFIARIKVMNRKKPALQDEFKEL